MTERTVHISVRSNYFARTTFEQMVPIYRIEMETPRCAALSLLIMLDYCFPEPVKLTIPLKAPKEIEESHKRDLNKCRV